VIRTQFISVESLLNDIDTTCSRRSNGI